MQIIFLIIFGWFSITNFATEIVRDGVPVVRPGIFVKQCIYGNDASLSDHAPMIYQIAAQCSIYNRVAI